MKKVKVYTMSSCPFCERAKALLQQKGIAFEEVRLALDDEPAWDALYRLSGMKTMPQIFTGDRLIGGFSELSQLDQQDGLASLK